MATLFTWLRLSALILALCVAFANIQGIFSTHWISAKPSDLTELLALSKEHQYSTEILSTDPLMFYLDGFLHPREAAYLLRLGSSREPHLAPSKVYVDPDSNAPPPPSSYRTSSSCVLPADNALVSLIKQRALSLMGFIPNTGVEALQLVRYGRSEKFGMHYDWFDSPMVDKSGERYNRIATLFLYLEANCTAGSTYFPRLPPPPESAREERFSTTANRSGLAVMPRAASGVFWVNLKADGTGDERTLHAGMPVGMGSKTGLNIWVKARV
ncbi:MAG: hypothetical protein Q9204_006981 [Flavoplaca sp. TL-2023a]